MEDTGVGGLDRPSKGIVLEAIEGLGSKAEGQYSTAKESCPSWFPHATLLNKKTVPKLTAKSNLKPPLSYGPERRK